MQHCSICQKFQFLTHGMMELVFLAHSLIREQIDGTVAVKAFWNPVNGPIRSYALPQYICLI